DRKKNLEGLMQAVQMVRAKNRGIVLDIAGDGDPTYVAQLRAKARDLGIEENVRWRGHLDGKTKDDVIATASAFALPSYSENFGIAVVEALAAGLPCLVSRGVAIASDIERVGAGIVTGTAPAEIARGLELLIGESTNKLAMSSAARELAR